MMTTKLEVNGLDSPERAKLLSVVDEFRALGISKEIALPQLVVVGDQSSGKSSLLEGLTGITFPTHSGLCTRFATRIILRRSVEEHVRVSIIPGPSAKDAAHREALLAFHPEIDMKGLTGPQFTKIMDEAAITMGLPSSTQTELENLEKRFSDDTFSIELSGPNHPHLSIVDVPGLFHNPTPTQTKEDLDDIRKMIKGYMKDKRTIILTVMDALNNLANQEIFNMARRADETGERIVGVITKCDAVSSHDEGPIIKIAQNKEYIFRHGWFAVRNRSTKEKIAKTSLEDRHAKEAEFFAEAPWSVLSKDRVGVPALKTYLADILYDHVLKEFPHLVNEIRTKVSETRLQVIALGESRTTPSEQRHFLTRIANQFQINNTDALRGTYSSTLRAKDPRKLRMHIAIENAELASTMHAEGHTYTFKSIEDMQDQTEEGAAEDTQMKMNEDENGEGYNDDGLGSELGGRALGSDVASDDDQDEADEHDDIYRWIETEYQTSRGAELPGTVNPAVLESLFRQQASSWGKIAEDYLKVVNAIVLQHIKRSFQHLITDEAIRHKVYQRTKRIVVETQASALAQLGRILMDDFGGILQTTNNYFAENLANNRHDRLLLRLKKYLDPAAKTSINGPVHVGINLEAMTKHAHLSNDQSAVYDIHDVLKAYYKVALKQFVDNVVKQITERCYLGDDGPLRYFSPAYVGGLSDKELNELVGENRSTTLERERLTLLLQQLEGALQLAEDQQ